MRIGVSDMYLDALGGGERYMLTIASCLANDHEVSVFWDDKSILEKAARRFSLDLSKVSILPNIFKESFNQKLQHSKQFDCIIHLSDGSIPLSFAKKTIIHFQHPITWVKPSFLTKLKMKRITAVIVNSQYTKSYIDKVFSVNSTILYPPCENIGTGDSKKENLILTVGRYNKLSQGNDFKKLEKMISAFKVLYDSGQKDYRFVLVVTHKQKDSNEIQRLNQEIKNYPIELLTETSHDRLVSLYKQAKIYWHAAGFQEDLGTHPERAEHFGISTVEAMSAGVVPVVINAGGLSEIVTNEKDGFLWSSESELLQKTSDIIKDDFLRERMANAAIERAKAFTQDMFCNTINQIVL